MTSEGHLARQMWTRYEPVNAVTYFSPEARTAFEAVGLRGYWRGYFGGRTAPLGAVGSSTVVATYYGFAPAMVERAVPDIWSRAAPADILRARLDGATEALRRILAGVDLGAIDEITKLSEEAADLLDPAGHVLGAANVALPRDPDGPPLGRLWQTAQTFREHRGDGHVAALVTYGFDGCEAIVWRCKPEFRAEMQQYRGWTDAEWEAATGRLTERGWVAGDGTHTAEGNAAYQAVEDATDRAAARVWTAFGVERTERLRDLLKPLAVACYPEVPMANPLNLPEPS